MTGDDFIIALYVVVAAGLVVGLIVGGIMDVLKRHKEVMKDD